MLELLNGRGSHVDLATRLGEREPKELQNQQQTAHINTQLIVLLRKFDKINLLDKRSCRKHAASVARFCSNGAVISERLQSTRLAYLDVILQMFRGPHQTVLARPQFPNCQIHDGVK